MCDVYVGYPEYINMFEFSIYAQDESGKRTEIPTEDFYGNEDNFDQDYDGNFCNTFFGCNNHYKEALDRKIEELFKVMKNKQGS